MKDQQINETMETETKVQEEKLFGMRRLRALGTMLGIAAGMILSGLIPALGMPWLSDVESCIFFGGAGYVIARLIDEKMHPETRLIHRKQRSSTASK